MPAPAFIMKSVETIKKNAPEILTGLGVTGVFTTAYFSGRAAIKSHIKLQEESAEEASLKERVKLTWTFYIPTVVSGGTTVVCIIASSRILSKRTVAAVAAYTVSTQAFNEYREKVAEEFGKGKERRLRDDLVQEEIRKNPPGPKEIIITGKGDVLCCEMHTRRYFKADIEALRRAENQINRRIFLEMQVPLDEFYDIVGLSHTSSSDTWGWDSDRLLELEFTTAWAENEEPCIAFTYNYLKPLW